MATKLISHQLISFDKNNNLIYNDKFIKDVKDNNMKLKVISIIGDARYGKSTLFNLILTKLTGKNQKTFKTGSSNKHCTEGILSCVYESKKDNTAYLFLDCQGINHEDSSKDVKLLLITYLLSDILIFNDKSLNNSTLKSLDPIVTMESFIPKKNIQKSKLLFRIRDYDLDDPIESVLDDTLYEHDDQFKKIKEVAKKIFSDISVCATNSIGQKYVDFLKKQEYTKFLKVEKAEYENYNDTDSDVDSEESSEQDSSKDDIKNKEIVKDYRFAKTIEFILSKLDDTDKNYNISDIKNRIPKWIKNINNNEKISHEIYDIYTNNMKININDFWDKYFDKNVYSKLELNRTQKYYDDIISPKLKSIEDFKNKFYTEHNNLSEEIKKKCFEEKINKEYNRIMECISKNHNIGVKYLEKLLNDSANCTHEIEDIFTSFSIVLNGYYNKRTHNILQYKESVLKYYNNFIDYTDVVNTAKKCVKDNIKNKVYSYINELTKENEQFYNTIKDFVLNVEGEIIENICTPNIFDVLSDIDLTQKYDTKNISLLFSEKINKYIEKYNEYIYLLTYESNYKLSNNLQKVDENIEDIVEFEDSNCKEFMELLDENYLDYFHKIISDYLDTDIIRKLYINNVNKKITELLETDDGKDYIKKNYQIIIASNPQIYKFIKIIWIKNSIYNDTKDDIFNNVDNAKKCLSYYVKHTKYTYELLVHLFSTTNNDNLLVIDFNHCDNDNLKNSIRIDILDNINRYYIDKFISDFNSEK